MNGNIVLLGDFNILIFILIFIINGNIVILGDFNIDRLNADGSERKQFVIF